MTSPIPSLQDPVSLRHQMSTLKHEIRLKQAQFFALEAQLSSVPRHGDTYFSSSPPTSSFSLPSFSTSTPRKRRSSLPRHTEGVPMLEIATNSGTMEKRPLSPTRSMNRIPVSAVSQARALAENGAVPTVEEPMQNGTSNSTNQSPSGLLDPPSPGALRRLSTGNTTKVLADLQAGVVHARQALENTRSQLRLAQRSVAQLTRQNEDLKDSRERLRLQNENLNSVVARKERLLQEATERARKAEAEASALKAQLKTDSTAQKKALREMELTVAESTSISERTTREYETLRGSVKDLQEGWQSDVQALRTELLRREETWKKEIDEVNLKYKSLVKLTQAAQSERAKMEALKTEKRELDAKFEEAFKEELRSLATALSENNKSSEDASATAKELSTELARIRRLMRLGGQSTEDPSPQIPVP